MPFGIGVWEIAVLLLVALLVFGPKRLPEMGRGLGRGMREFKDSVSGITNLDDRPVERTAAREDGGATVLAGPPAERDSA